MSALAIATYSEGCAGGSPRMPTGQVVTLAPELRAPGVVRTFARDEEIFVQEGDASHIYKVLSGAVRVTSLLSDGRRLIVSFHFAGDVFGLEVGAAHSFTAEAITSCRIASVRRAANGAQSDANGVAISDLWNALSEELQRMQQHALLLGRMSAVERVTMFLREVAGRMGTLDVVELPMSRLDIADYLGLTIETVSRTLTQLHRDGDIDIEGKRHIVLRQSGASARWAA
jgi:CRP/FNR family nitrogen fixation transcriptional regulator